MNLPTEAHELIFQALQLREDEREPFLEVACKEPRLRLQLMGLIRDRQKLRAFLDQLDSAALQEDGLPQLGGQTQQLGVKADSDSAASGEPIPTLKRNWPENIGPFRILELLGEGGMGVVFLAEQKRPVARQLALKLIRSSFPRREVTARFEAERQAMARLSHPNIAQIYEAGTTADGHPYFAMEYVPGQNVLEYCDQKRLPINQRLQLFVAICQGVQHAHQRGIIHRDLKPSNILITEIEGRPVPKIIDFGIAKAVDHPLTDTTHLTRGIVGTPAYMSPESLLTEADALDLDTRTDVYALGILLYELLTGVQPLDATGMAQIVQILNDDAPRPSARLDSLDGDTGDRVASHRQTVLTALRRRLHGDLDWIVARAIAKQREDRYPTAAELGADIERHLSHQPVSARPPSMRYQASRFVRRHRGAVIAALLSVLALIAGTVGISVGLVRARAAEAQARLDASSARLVSDFLVDLFRVSDPGQALGNEITARELLDRGAERITNQLSERPLVRARMLGTLGSVYEQMGLHDDAEPLLDEALSLQRQELGNGQLEVIESLIRLGRLYRQQGRLDDAETVLREALELHSQRAQGDSTASISALQELADVYTDHGDFTHAHQLLRRALAASETGYGADAPETAAVLWSLGRNTGFLGRLPQSIELYERARTIQETTLGPDHPQLAQTLSNLANSYGNLGDGERAEQLSRQALSIFEKVLGPEHPQISRVLSNLGYNLFRTGRYQEARAPLERAVAIDEKILRYEHPYSAARLTNLGLVYWKLGMLEEAEPLFQRARAIRQRVLAPGHPHHATSLWGLANIYREQQRFEEAEELYREALDIRQKALPPEHAELHDALREYAVLLRQLDRGIEAAALESRLPTGD